MKTGRKATGRGRRRDRAVSMGRQEAGGGKGKQTERGSKEGFKRRDGDEKCTKTKQISKLKFNHKQEQSISDYF